MLSKKKPPTVVWFNPWEFAAGGRGAIQEALLEQVTWAVLESEPNRKRRWKLRKLAKKYGPGSLAILRQLPDAGIMASVGETALAMMPDNRKKLM